MNWDTEIWAPCRLGEAFTLRDLGHEKEQYLYAIKADWMGHHGDAMCVRCADDLEKTTPHNVRIGAGPRPWANCWTYEAKIKITPPAWCWDMQDDTMFGLELKPKRNGNRRKVKLDCVKIHEGRPVYRIVVEKSDGDTFLHLDSIPVLDPYFAPIWPATTEETPEVAEPAPEPVADPVAGTMNREQLRQLLTKTDTQQFAATFSEMRAAANDPTQKTVTNAAEAEQTPENTEQTTDSENSATVAILPSLANCPERDTTADALDAAVYAVGGIIHTPGQKLEAGPGELIVPLDQLRRVLTTSNAADMVAAYIAQADEDTPASWTGTENRPPGACIGGQLPFSGKYYYYVWFEEPPTEGETYEQKAGP